MQSESPVGPSDPFELAQLALFENEQRRDKYQNRDLLLQEYAGNEMLQIDPRSDDYRLKILALSRKGKKSEAGTRSASRRPSPEEKKEVGADDAAGVDEGAESEASLERELRDAFAVKPEDREVWLDAEEASLL